MERMFARERAHFARVDVNARKGARACPLNESHSRIAMRDGEGLRFARPKSIRNAAQLYSPRSSGQ